MNRFLRRFRFRANRSELEAEIDVHLQMATADRQANGLSSEEARRQAQRDFGNIGLVKDVTREMWGLLWLERIGQDLKYALRQLRRSPAFAATIIGTLALGIGAATAMFTAVDHILLTPLPYPQAERLVEINVFGGNGEPAYVKLLNIGQWKEQSRSLEKIALYRLSAEREFLKGDESLLPIEVTQGSTNLFDTLGVKPHLGSGFQPEQLAQTSGRNKSLIVLSDAAWKNAYGADPRIVGKAVQINNSSYTIVGVMPAGFRFPLRGLPFIGDIPQAWVSFDATDQNLYEIVARLAPRVTANSVRAELDTVQKNASAEYAATAYLERPTSVRVLKYTAL